MSKVICDTNIVEQPKTSNVELLDLLVIGGGAAGFFTAINAAERYPQWRITILEKGKEPLQKVRISGGGRCNLTNAEYVPQEFVRAYPRGAKELLSPFHRFMSGDVMEWFEAHGVPVKIEADGRVFPDSNNSESIINCFMKAIQKSGIALLTAQNVRDIQFANDLWQVQTATDTFTTERLVVTTGSNPKMWDILARLGHTIVPPVPSLFTFHTDDTFIKDLAGVSAEVALSLLSTEGTPLKVRQRGPLLITHWGFSGPAVLRASAWGARLLADRDYQCVLQVNWTAASGEELTFEQVLADLQEQKAQHAKRQVYTHPLYGLPKRLWERITEREGIAGQLWAEVGKPFLRDLAMALTASHFRITGKATFKEEFVTAGGVRLSEVNFKTFESKLHPRLYLAGEVLDIDAVTGGFNFQNAWTGGYVIADSF
ncbi:hypothetical protein SAMN05444369_11192 [Capnocytophaga haemolytica]|uniref:Dihydrolipoamide dehydrogenase n=1 Tax=Capnocytophaga haemolytica TaxID=45243 RepID=A0AAX2GZT2_9FLAO|nr:NAD(P)/FAD-dependent oxidoreductase [Capnocytophaga haemolytica]AMD86021.1 flavoprotein [Capnocytophaga haemolytica]SFO16834.1 hypothetical protein SAMN05444369_11192 [Capnocytophaga haemolytica]SNV14746.1 dihydrolipoamide dehydrogenase [Capnocytophaga haemolytica]